MILSMCCTGVNDNAADVQLHSHSYSACATGIRRSIDGLGAHSESYN